MFTVRWWVVGCRRRAAAANDALISKVLVMI